MTAKSFKKGFTLIELLIVMAILGVLAVVILIAINPAQQLARTRDTGRKSAVSQLGRAVTAYFTSRGTFFPESGTWITTLVNSGELSVVPSSINYGAGVTSCATNAQNNFCYREGGGTAAVVYARLESNVETSKCGGTGTNAFFVWSTADARGGTVCLTGTNEPSPGTQAFID